MKTLALVHGSSGAVSGANYYLFVGRCAPNGLGELSAEIRVKHSHGYLSAPGYTLYMLSVITAIGFALLIVYIKGSEARSGILVIRE